MLVTIIMKACFLLFFAALANCKSLEKVETRIIGGSLASVGQFPYQVGLIVDRPELSQSFASASLITSTRVLTAAHNVQFSNGRAIGVTSVLGSLYLFHGGTRIYSEEIHVHAEYDGFIVNDIAIIYLPEAVAFSDTIAPVALPFSPDLVNEDFTGADTTASGYGLTEVGFNQAVSYVHLKVISNEQCSATFGSIILSSNICTSGEGIVGICQGDSGGPLVTYRNNIPVVIGVTSFGTGGCMGGQPDGYARVTSYQSFIESHL